MEFTMFTPQEIAYINSQRLARLATGSNTLEPDVAPLVFRFNGKTFLISGYDISRTFKYMNIKAGSQLVALVIADLVSGQPWQARGIKIHAKAEIVEITGPLTLAVHPQRLWSWGMAGQAF